MNLLLLWRAAIAVFGLLVLGALLTIGRWLPTAPSLAVQPAASAAGSLAAGSADCRRCHAAVWQEWEVSYHAQAFQHPHVQAAFKHFGHDRQCESCHASEPVLVDFTAPVALRPSDRQSGVNCLVCHQRADGRMAARRTLPAAPCQPVTTPELTSSAHCGRCHTAIHADWQSSALAGTDKTCQTCHMPAVAGRSGGKSHLCIGGHDDATVKSGAVLDCRVDKEQLVVTVTNHATGHNFPGERHNRILLVQAIERGADGQIMLAEQRTIKAITPFRGESSSEQIPIGQSFEVAFPIVPSAVAAEVQLLYKLFPWMADRDALIVHRQELKLP